MQICSIFALLPYLSTSLPTQFHQLGTGKLKKSYFLNGRAIKVPPSLTAVGIFFLLETDFEKFFPPPIFGLKYSYFLAKIITDH